MGLLDAYDTYVNNKCEEIEKENGTFESLTSALGLSKLLDGVKGFCENGIVQGLLDSPLRTLAEDLLAQTVHDASRRLTQNLMDAADRFDKKNKITATLTNVRSLVFNAVTTALTFQNDMVMYFAVQVAKKATKAIQKKRATLIGLQEAVRRLHNALLTLAGGGKFFNKYLEDLRAALLLIDSAEKNLARVQSAFFSQNRFPKSNYEKAKQDLDAAFALIMPKPTGNNTDTLNNGLLKGVFVLPDLNLQIGMLLTIPRLTLEMLKAYDAYALQVIKVNLLILGFQNIVQNLKEVTGGAFKDLILDQLDKSRLFIRDIRGSMALNLNGDQAAITEPILVPAGSGSQRFLPQGANVQLTPFKPNPTVTSAKATIWSVRIKAARVMLEAIDVDALKRVETSNNALRAYTATLETFSKLNDRVSSTARLRATAGREQPGDIEADFVTLAFQANQAILDSSLLENQNGRFSSRSVLALGSKMISRLQLSIDQDKEIEDAFYSFIAAAEDSLKGLNELGNSIFKVMDSLGMDRAKEALQNGAFGDFFNMSGQTATYVGAAVTGLSLVQSLLSDANQKTCLNVAVNELRSAQTSKDLAASRSVSVAFPKQQERNTKLCEKLKNNSSKVDGCSSTLDPTTLRDNPGRSLSGLFRGVFGGDIAQTMGGSTVALGSPAVAGLVASDASSNALASASKAKSAMTGALTAAGVPLAGGESVDALKKMTDAARTVSEGPTKALLDSASISGKVAQLKGQDAAGLIQKANITPNLFGG